MHQSLTNSAGNDEQKSSVKAKDPAATLGVVNFPGNSKMTNSFDLKPMV